MKQAEAVPGGLDNPLCDRHDKVVCGHRDVPLTAFASVKFLQPPVKEPEPRNPRTPEPQNRQRKYPSTRHQIKLLVMELLVRPDGD